MWCILIKWSKIYSEFWSIYKSKIKPNQLTLNSGELLFCRIRPELTEIELHRVKDFEVNIFCCGRSLCTDLTYSMQYCQVQRTVVNLRDKELLICVSSSCTCSFVNDSISIWFWHGLICNLLSASDNPGGAAVGWPLPSYLDADWLLLGTSDYPGGAAVGGAGHWSCDKASDRWRVAYTKYSPVIQLSILQRIFRLLISVKRLSRSSTKSSTSQWVAWLLLSVLLQLFALYSHV